ncbi:MAG: hypothetical protein ACRCXT_10495 [Paraclostridium sp.]
MSKLMIVCFRVSKTEKELINSYKEITKIEISTMVRDCIRDIILSSPYDDLIEILEDYYNKFPPICGDPRTVNFKCRLHDIDLALFKFICKQHNLKHTIIIRSMVLNIINEKGRGL